MTCEMFLARMSEGLDAEALEHMRSCDDCLNAAAEVDPFLIFRALGGQEIEPPEGTDAFVAEVMQQVRGEERKRRIESYPKQSPWLRWGAAAAVLTAALTFGLTFRPGLDVPSPGSVSQITQTQGIEMLNRPVIEHYDSAGAMIIEVPESSNDMQLVMIFDESLPADL